MNTYSHVLITAALREKYRHLNIHAKGFLIGSFMPDVPLVVLTLGYWAYRAAFEPLQPGEGIFGARYDALFFSNPFWIISHNMFHAPLVIALLAGLGYLAQRRGQRWGAPLLWFAAGCGIHSAIDIPTHGNDGPLLLFPLNWDMRFHSPISYWDRNYYADIFAPLEHLLVLGILLYLVQGWLRRRQARLTEEGV
jgi:hypothetical protein